VPLDEFEQAYDRLLAAAVAANPRLRLVPCEPFTLPTGKHQENFDEWSAAVQKRRQAVARLAAKYHAAVVRFQPVFDDACQRAPAEYWIWDGIHPTYSGHQLMAGEWELSVRQFWPE